MHSGDLFEDLRRILLCDYVSDLKQVDQRPAAKRFLAYMDLYRYPLYQLSDMAQYLYDRREPFRSYQEAAAFFAAEDPAGGFVE